MEWPARSRVGCSGCTASAPGSTGRRCHSEKSRSAGGEVLLQVFVERHRVAGLDLFLSSQRVRSFLPELVRPFVAKRSNRHEVIAMSFRHAVGELEEAAAGCLEFTEDSRRQRPSGIFEVHLQRLHGGNVTAV